MLNEFTNTSLSARMRETIVTLIIICSFINKVTAQSLQEIYAQGTQAYESADFGTFLRSMQQADSIRPNHPTILYNLAAAYALNDAPEKSVDVLERVVWMNAEIRFDEDEDFLSLKEFTPFSELKTLQEDLMVEVREGNVFQRIPDKTLHPEGVAYSMELDMFFVGSVRLRKIISIDRNGNVDDFLKQADFMSIMGMKVDEQNNWLWVCSTPTPEMIDFKEGLHPEVICIDLNTREVVGRYAAPFSNDWLGDLTISSEGQVFVSNSIAENPTIYQVDLEKDTLSTLLEAKRLISIQGITLNEDESAMFIADYRYGILKYDFEDEKLTELENQTPHSLKGIDGVWFSSSVNFSSSKSYFKIPYR